MYKITETSPKRLIVVDAVDDLARQLFGDKYDYEMTTSLYDSLEGIYELKKPKWVTVLGAESSELYDYGRTIQNEVLINVVLATKVPSNHLSHAIEYLTDIETIKHNLIGCTIEHKEHFIYGNVQNEELPSWSTEHNIDTVASILRIVFSIVLRIDDDRN